MNRMLLIIAVLFAVMKVAAGAMSDVRMGGWRWVAFAMWPGMRPETFRKRGRCSGRRVASKGVSYLVGGAALFAFARWLAPRSLVAAIIVALPALSLILHFGIFSLATAFWRALGFPAEELFRAPWRSQSLAEFWSRRWNLGFSEMIAIVVHRPVAARFGRRAGIAAAFLVSGLLHELAISVPARGGYGLPMLYFALHGALVTADVRGRAVTALALILPLPILFHPPFLRTIIVPLLLR